MEIVLDTVCLKHILQNPKSRKTKRTGNRQFETCLDVYLKTGKLVLALDSSGGLINEWERTCGVEIVGVIISKWEEFGSIIIVKQLPRINNQILNKLRNFGFDDTIDKLILKIALALRDQIVVSNDKDFWDPKSKSQRGNVNASVAKLCREELGIIILLLRSLLARIAT